MAIKYKHTPHTEYKHLAPSVSEIICTRGNMSDSFYAYLHPSKVKTLLDKRVQVDLNRFGIFKSPGISVRLLSDKTTKKSIYGMFCVEVIVDNLDQLFSIMPVKIAAELKDRQEAFRLEEQMAKI